MRALDWLKGGDDQVQRPLYIVYGDDVYLRREVIRRAIEVEIPGEDSEVGVVRSEGSSAKLADVIDELRTLPFFSKRRVVLVEEADPFVSAYRKELEAYVEAPSRSGSLILAVRTWLTNTRLAKAASILGLAVDCSSPKEADLLRWLPTFAKSRGAKLGAEAAKLLLELVGPETGLLAAEIDKLSVATAHHGEIRREDVARYVESGRIEEIWDVVNAATEGKGAVAAKLLDDLIAKGEHPIKLLAQMTSTLVRLHHAGRLRALRMSPAEACEASGIRPFLVQQVVRQHGHLGPVRVDRLPGDLLQADLDLKGGSQLHPRVILEMLLIRLSQPRVD